MADNPPMTNRLNKHIAETGFCSRREADRLISARRVTVNGMPAGTGAVVGEGDEVRVDGQPLRARAVHLVVSGQDKRAILRRVQQEPHAPYPVAALLHAPAPAPIHIHWSP